MTKLEKCLGILKTYGVLVDFHGNFRAHAGKGKGEKETVSAWKRRVLGTEVADLVFYIPIEMAPQKRMSSLKQEGGANHIVRLLSQLIDLKELDNEGKLKEAQRELMEKYSTIPKRALREVVEAMDEDLEPSVREFFERFLVKTDRRVDSVELLRELAGAYNKVVAEYRKMVGIKSEKG